PPRGGFCLFCNSKAENSYTCDPNAYSFNDTSRNFNHLPQPQYETYPCELCGNDSHYGYDCPLRFSFVYDQEPCYNQNFNENYYPHNLPSFLCCDNCEGPHECFQCQSMNQNFLKHNPCYEPNSSSFDQYQPLQSFVTQQIPQRSNEDIQLEMAKLIKNNRILLNNNTFPHEETSMGVLLSKERILKLIQAWDEKQIESWSFPELLLQILNDSRTIDEMLKQRVKKHEQMANLAVQKEQEEQAVQSFTPYWNFSMIDDEEVIQSRENFMKAIQIFLQKFSRYSFGVMPKVLLIAWERFSEIKHAFTDKQYQPEEIRELMCKLLEDLQIISEELAEYINSSSWNHPTFYNDDEEHSIQYKEYVENSSNAITTVLPTEEPEYSLSMGYEHLSIIPKIDSDEVIKSSVKNLVQFPSEFEVTSDDESEYDVPVKDESSLVFTTFSNPIFDYNDDFTSKINSDKIDPHYFNAESDLIESLSNRDTLFDSYPKFDYLEEFSGELMPTSIVNEERIKREHEEYISLMEKLLTINSFPRPLENFHANTIIETLPTSPIPVEDSDPFREEIDYLPARMI
nr:hypothetical protein [Tanacetum cinerariifolium]